MRMLRSAVLIFLAVNSLSQIIHAALGLLLGYATNLTLGLISVGCVGFLGIPFYFFAAHR